jgi:hypothetical protein
MRFLSISILFGLVLLMLSSMTAFPPQAPVEWQESTVLDLGDLPRDQAATTAFTFRNTGKEALYIDNVRVACGCTSPDWQDLAVEPDSIGTIQLEYDASDPGYFRKWVKVYFRGYRKAEKLWIEGYVEGI